MVDMETLSLSPSFSLSPLHPCPFMALHHHPSFSSLTSLFYSVFPDPFTFILYLYLYQCILAASTLFM